MLEARKDDSLERERTIREGWVVGSIVDHRSLEGSVSATFYKLSHFVN